MTTAQQRLEVGAHAPAIDLPDQHRAQVRSADLLAERSLLVVFFPFAFSGVCSGELTGFRDRLGDFETETSTLVAISCDPVFALRAFADRDALFFPLLSDFWPHGATASAYGVLDPAGGNATRSSFLLDRDGVVRWSVHNQAGTARDLDEHAAAVRSLA